MESKHWAYTTAKKVLKEKGDKEQYVCAAGITPSGIIHIGNFRELITSCFVAKGLEKSNKKIKLLCYLDDFDRFRRIPPGVDKSFEKYIGMPISNIPDPFKCHKSYAEHFKKEFQDSIKPLNFKINFIKQSYMYKNCIYAKEIKEALINRDKIRRILNKYRKEKLTKDWVPLEVYCEKCKKDTTKILKYNEKYEIIYECECGFSNTIDFRKKGIVKLPWRIQWPVWWIKENVDFEPAGKDHYASGGSRITANEIIEKVWSIKHPTDLIYEWIGLKGGGQFSSSKGIATTPKEVLEVYQPELMLYLFAGAKPNVEFAISFDTDVIKIYEDFDFCERVYYGKEDVSDKEKMKQRGIYEMCSIEKIPDKIPIQPSFRHLTTLIQLYEGDINKVIKEFKIKNNFDKKRIETRAKCALSWLKKYAPENLKFKLHKKIDNQIKNLLTKEQKEALNLLNKKLKSKKYNEQTLFNEFYKICHETGIKNIDFFKGAYLSLIGKEKGPKLAHFILSIGKKRITNLLSQL